VPSEIEADAIGDQHDAGDTDEEISTDEGSEDDLKKKKKSPATKKGN